MQARRRPKMKCLQLKRWLRYAGSNALPHCLYSRAKLFHVRLLRVHLKRSKRFPFFNQSYPVGIYGFLDAQRGGNIAGVYIFDAALLSQHQWPQFFTFSQKIRQAAGFYNHCNDNVDHWFLRK